jgi:hypothetical protein
MRALAGVVRTIVLFGCVSNGDTNVNVNGSGQALRCAPTW